MNKLSKLLLATAVVLFFSASAEAVVRIIHGPYLQSMGENEVTIVWQTDGPSTGWVELAPDDKSHFYSTARPKFYHSKDGVKQVGTTHTVTLKGLSPATTYRYRIYSEEVVSHNGTKASYGNIAATDVYRKEPLKFTTNDKTKGEVSFSMVNDIHGRAEVMKELLNAADYSSKDFILFNGDMVSSVPDVESMFTGFMDTAIEMFAKEKPMYYSRGNHETRGAGAVHFHEFFSQGYNDLYFMFKQGPVCVLVLDTGEDKPDDDIEYYGLSDFTAYRAEQALWLKKIVESEDWKNAEFRVVVAHMPMNGSRLWYGPLDCAAKFLPTLNGAEVDVMLCGHLHKNIYLEADEQVKFPVLINSNNSVVNVKADKKSLHLEVLDQQGNKLNSVNLQSTF